jgi:hypothetical protein
MTATRSFGTELASKAPKDDPRDGDLRLMGAGILVKAGIQALVSPPCQSSGWFVH